MIENISEGDGVWGIEWACTWMFEGRCNRFNVVQGRSTEKIYQKSAF